MHVRTRRSLRHYARNAVVAVVLIAIPCAGTTYFLPPSPRLASYDVIETAAIDTSNTTVGISDPYLSFPFRYPDLGAIDQSLDAMEAIGVQNVRIQVSWALVQPNNANEFDWSRVDTIVNAAAARGMGVLAVISHTPGWATDSPINGQPDPETYADFASAVAQRYDGKISAYEVWNEPNANLFYNPADPVAYTALLKAAYRAIKDVDPSIVVVGGVLSSAVTLAGQSVNPVDFLRAMYAAGAKGYFDAFSFHPYVYPVDTAFSAGVGYPDSAISQLAAIRQIMLDNADPKLVWATEFGVPTGPGVSGATQAAIIQDFLQTWSKYDFTGPTFIHTLQDLAANSSDPEDNFGIVDVYGNPKPAVQVISDWIAAHLSPTPTPTVDPFQALVIVVQAFFQGIAKGFNDFVVSVVSFLNSVVAAISNPGGSTIAAAAPVTVSTANAVAGQQLTSETAAVSSRHVSVATESDSRAAVGPASADDDATAIQTNPSEADVPAGTPEPTSAESTTPVVSTEKTAVPDEKAVVAKPTSESTVGETPSTDEKATVEDKPATGEKPATGSGVAAGVGAGGITSPAEAAETKKAKKPATAKSPAAEIASEPAKNTVGEPDA